MKRVENSCNDPCQCLLLASATASAIADGQPDDEVAALGALFVLVGDALAYIVAQRVRCKALACPDADEDA